ncbi:hypothetical protein HanPSC8_Chr02g0062371 [Helianthus annuus]|nr:hypothetical protein HanPSC8_Chr02g0062371 [Helianthus annuus]
MMMVPLVFGFRFQASVREGAGATTHTHTQPPPQCLDVVELLYVK